VSAGNGATGVRVGWLTSSTRIPPPTTHK
jgi:hypothetical protein